MSEWIRVKKGCTREGIEPDGLHPDDFVWTVRKDCEPRLTEVWQVDWRKQTHWMHANITTPEPPK